MGYIVSISVSVALFQLCRIHDREVSHVDPLRWSVHDNVLPLLGGGSGLLLAGGRVIERCDLIKNIKFQRLDSG